MHTNANVNTHTVDDEVETVDTAGIRAKIMFLLGMYPIVSPSMLQVAMGAYLPPRIWKPVLEQMVQDGTVHKRDVSILNNNGQNRFYTLLSLKDPSPQAQP